MTIWTLRNVRTRGLVFGCLLMLGCASSPPGTAERHLARAAARLQQQSDADSLAAAGLFQGFKNRTQTIAFLARAEAAAPALADLVWLYIRVCQEEPSCDPQPEEQKLRTLSPANAAGWLGVLTRAFAAHDDVAQDAALIAIARTERLDIYWNTLVGHLSVAAVRAGMPPAEAMLAVSGIVAAVGIPAYAPVSNSCKGDRLERDGILEACRGVAHAFENGDTVITEMVDVGIAKRLWPEGSVEWQAAAERRRVYAYRSELWKPLEPVMWSAAQAQKYITLCLEQPREQDVSRAR